MTQDVCSTEGGKTLYRNFDRWSRLTKTSFSSPDAFCTAAIPNGLNTIWCGDIPIDISVAIEKGAPLVITLHGNAPRGNNNPPFFSGYGVIPKDRPVSHIAISDPSLAISPDLSLAWFAGFQGFPLQQILPRLIGHIVDFSATRNVIFFGGSGGAFAGLYYSALFPQSTALIWNPQTDILQYNPRHVQRYKETCFPAIGVDGDAAMMREYAQTDILDRYRQHANNVIYLQNQSDWHVARHMNVFLRASNLAVPDGLYSGLISDRLFLHVGDWAEGHVPPPKPVLTAMLTGLMQMEPAEFPSSGQKIADLIAGSFQVQETLAKED